MSIQPTEASPHSPPPVAARYLARRMATRAASGTPRDGLRWLIVWWRGGPGPDAMPSGDAAPRNGDRSRTRAPGSECAAFAFA